MNREWDEDLYREAMKEYQAEKIAENFLKDGISKEICGGPHAKRTKELGYFHIEKEESSSAGVRRIRATLNGGK